MGPKEERKMKRTIKSGWKWPLWSLALSFFLVEVFAFAFLAQKGEGTGKLWPLVFGIIWAVLLTALVRLLPWKAGRAVYGIGYYLVAVYSMIQTGYYLLFSELMWLTDFLYASEGSDYFSVLLSYPVGWWLGVLGLTALGGVLIWRFPRWEQRPGSCLGTAVVAAVAVLAAWNLPEMVFDEDKDIRYARSDYSRVQSAEAAYTNMFNAYRLYQVCGLHQMLIKDIYSNHIYPLSPAYAQAQKEQKGEIDAYFADREDAGTNSMTGLLEGKNVVLVLMESMDDWMIGDHTPTISRLMEEGVNFTQFYTPVYGGVRTFNSEFCINTGSYLSSAGGFAFDYVTNTYSQSLASRLEDLGYSAKTFHYNDPNFYSRGVFSPAMGYEEYVYYGDYLEDVPEDTAKDLLYDDCLLFDNQGLKAEFFREGQPTLNFVITRSAHLSYKYNEVLSYWGLKKYPQYRTLTDNEETNCALLKARLVDDFFARLMQELEAQTLLEDTVIIGVTDHYTYGYKDEQSLLALSGTGKSLLLEKTPCFIWSPELKSMEVEKTMATCDLLPTLLNLLGVEGEYHYIGRDIFSDSYSGYALFSDGSWITGNWVYDAAQGQTYDLEGKPVTIGESLHTEMTRRSQEFIRVNNLILKTNYYKK